MKKSAAILVLTALFILGSLTVLAAAGDDIASKDKGGKIDSVCGQGQLSIADRLIDGSPYTTFSADPSNKWCCVQDTSNASATPHVPDDHWVIIDFGSEKSFDKFFVYLASPAEGAQYDAYTFSFEVSNDKNTWVEIDSVKENVSTSADPKGTYEKTLSAPVKARYFKMVIPVAQQPDGIPPAQEPIGTTRIYGINVFESAAAGTFPGGGAAPTAPGQVPTNPGATGGDKAPATGSMGIILLTIALLGSGLVVYRLRKA